MAQDMLENGDACDYRMLKRQLQADIDYRILGQHMQAARKKRGMTQAAVAEKMKVGTKYYSAIESGTVKISLYRFIQFICLMGTTADQLLMGCHADYPPSHQCPDDASDDRKAIYALMDQCTEDQIKALRIIIDGLMTIRKP